MMNEVLPAKFAKEREGKTFVKDLQYYPGLEWERIVNSKNRPKSERNEGFSIQYAFAFFLAFLAGKKEPKTMECIKHTLKTGKPLRN